jgi:penicillin amidase
MSKTGKIIIGLTVSVALLLMAAGGVVYYLLHKSIADYAATISVEGLSKPATLYYDEYAVPHIVADSEDDLFFALGFAHARERLWQMEISRRAADGRMAEILGEGGVSFDKLFRTIGFRRMADSLWHSVSPETKKMLQAYSNGVNAYIAANKNHLPIEFDILQYTPEPWTPVNSLGIVRLMGWELNISWWTDIVLTELTAKLGKEKAMQVYPDYPTGKPTIITRPVASQPKPTKPKTGNAKPTATLDELKILEAFQEVDNGFRKYFGTSASHLGSNAWAVTKSKSSTGKALLANDPHLGFMMPARWYEVQLTCEAAGINASGCSLPGVAGLVLGKNDSIAWGLTNVMADDCDFFIIEADSTDKSKYLTPSGKAAFVTIDEEIKVKGKNPINFEVRLTKYGPIINDIHPKSTLTASTPIALKWTGHEQSDEALALYRAMKAKNWTTFRNGLRTFCVPGQNFVYADAAGNIGYQAGVLLPMRTDVQPANVKKPKPDVGKPLEAFLVRTFRDEWKGFVPFDSLPSVLNPTENFIVTANNKTIDDAYPYYISSLWEPPARAERIRQMLTSKATLSAADFEKMQTDVYSASAFETVPYIFNAVPDDSTTHKALQYFRNWDYNFTTQSIAASIYEHFYIRLIENTFRDEMGDTIYAAYIRLANLPVRVMAKLLRDSTVVVDSSGSHVVYNAWFDDVTTKDKVETRDDIIRKSFLQALDSLKKNVGTDMAQWQWGKIHTLTMKHILGSGDIRVFKTFFNIGPFETGGTGTSINNGEFKFDKPFDHTLGASSRRVIDFSEAGEFKSVMPAGNSGEPLSPHYADQTRLWLSGTLKTFVTDKTQFEKRAFQKTTMLPK